MRGKRELNVIHRNVAGFATQVFPRQRLFVINAYSMGAWATGTNTGIAMAKIAMVKNTGPDLDKIIDTIEHPGRTTTISSPPPTLPQGPARPARRPGVRLGRARDVWPRRRRGMTEALRDYCEQRFRRVLSGYGASDLTIGMGAESRLTVWLRDQIVADEALKADLLGPDDPRIPMVFQYNPLETHLEVTDEGELLCTLNSSIVLSPKLRYNIGDEAKLLDFPDLEKLIARHPRHEAGFRAAQAVDRMKLPLLFLYGRADSTVSFMGANIYPQDIEYGLYEDNPRAGDIEAFMLTLEEDAELDSRPVVNICAREGVHLDDAGRGPLRACEQGIVAHLTAVSRDFKQSLEEDPPLPGSTCASMTSAPDPSRAASPRSRRSTSASRPPKPLHQKRPHEICRLLQGATHRPGGCNVHRRHPLQRHSCVDHPLVDLAQTRQADEGDARLLLAHRLLRAAFHPSAPSPTSTPAMTC